jgi:RNA recognition motif-containing protein
MAWRVRSAFLSSKKKKKKKKKMEDELYNTLVNEIKTNEDGNDTLKRCLVALKTSPCSSRLASLCVELTLASDALSESEKREQLESLVTRGIAGYVEGCETLWRSARQLDLEQFVACFELLTELDNDDDNDSEREELSVLMEQCARRVVANFCAQLRCVAADYQATIDEFEQFSELAADLVKSVDFVGSSRVTALCERAKHMRAKRAPFDEIVGADDGSDLAALAHWCAYFALEEGEQAGDSDDGDCGYEARVSAVYERALVVYPCVDDVWLRYAAFLRARNSTRLAGVAERATRAAPWCAELWSLLARAVACHGDDGVQQVWERARTQLGEHGDAPALCALWLDCIGDARRAGASQRDIDAQLDDAERAVRAAMGADDGLGDALLPLFRLRASLAVHAFGDAAAMRAVTERWLDEPMLRARANVWLECIALEQCSDRRRALFARAADAVKDWHDSLLCAWQAFERIAGDAQQQRHIDELLASCRRRIDTASAVEAHERMVYERHRQSRKRAKSGGDDERQPAKRQRRAHSSSSSSSSSSSVSESSPSSESSSVSEPRQPVLMHTVKIGRLPPEMCRRAEVDRLLGVACAHCRFLKGRSRGTAFVDFDRDESLRVALGKNGAAELGGAKKLFVVPASATLYIGAEPKLAVRPKLGKGDASLTCYVANLSAQTTERQVAEHFAQCGDIDAIRTLRTAKGERRRFAYIDFGSQQAVDAALQRNESTLDGATISVVLAKSNNDDDAKKKRKKTIKKIAPVKERNVVTSRRRGPRLQL